MASGDNDTKNTTEFDRKALMDELNALEEAGEAKTSSQHYKEYLNKLKALNKLMDSNSKEDEFGVAPNLSAEDKNALLEAMKDVALAGETFLADLENKKVNMRAGVPRMVNRMQGILSRDFDMLRLYDPDKEPMSFPEIQSNARSQVVDFRGKKIGVMTNRLSGRIPMTVVDSSGKRVKGVFTKASYVSIKKDYNDTIKKVTDCFDSPAFQNSIGIYKKALINNGAFGNGHIDPDQITPKMVTDKLKEPFMNIIPSFRKYLDDIGADLYGIAIDKATDEQVLGFFYNQVMESGVTETLQKAGVELNYLPEEAMDILKEDFHAAVKERLSDVVNARDLGLHDGDRVDSRNSAMSALAGVLGLNKMCARSVNMKYLDEEGNEVEGTFMELAEGLDLMGKNGDKLFVHVADDPFGSPCKAIPELADMQILDFLSGNVDRHGGNMTYKVDENGKIAGVMAIDNDTSFGTVPIQKKSGVFRLAGVDQLKVITEDMANKISKMTPEMLKFSLRGRGLTDDEMKAACQRLTDLKDKVKEGLHAKSLADLVQANNGPICIMKREDMEKVPINALADEKNVFKNVRDYMNESMEEAREKGYEYDANAKRPDSPNLTEVSTTERKFTAGGIADSMGDMARMIKNEVTGFVVSGLSKFLHSSGKWRSMISAVENAEKISKQIRKEIGTDRESLSRDDPKVRAQLEKADRAMAQAEKATEEYLKRKMKEKNVKTPEELVGRGKHAYEQKRIDYALKLRKSIQKYKELNAPKTDLEKAQKAAADKKIKMVNARKAAAGPKVGK